MQCKYYKKRFYNKPERNPSSSLDLRQGTNNISVIEIHPIQSDLPPSYNIEEELPPSFDQIKKYNKSDCNTF